MQPKGDFHGMNYKDDTERKIVLAGALSGIVTLAIDVFHIGVSFF